MSDSDKIIDGDSPYEPTTIVEKSRDELAVEKDVEGDTVKIPYPKSIAFIVSNEFCERFNFYGMKAILVLYLTRKLMFDDDTATVFYHSFTTMVYFMCVFGAIIADSWLGKFKTILYLSIIYVCGSIIVAVGAIQTLDLPMRVMTLIGLLLIAFGSGGIKPCVSAFGGEQFKMPEQAAQIATFFSLFYFAVNSGSLISTTVTPILREDVHCFGENDCYSLAFGVPGMLMVLSIIIFVSGKRLYKIVPAAGNMFVKVTKCIFNAISVKRKEKKLEPREHWLEYSEKKYGKQLVNETKILLNVLTLYLPLPIFWTLFDQQGSRWTFQATRMNGDIGIFTIKPDQMQVINPLLILAFIPLYEVAFYPLLSLIGIRRPLQKLTLGGIFAGIAFVISAIVEIQLEETYAVIPKAGDGQLRIFNGLSCDMTINPDLPDYESFVVKSLENFEEKYIKIKGTKSIKYTATGSCGSFEDIIELEEKKQVSYFLAGNRDDDKPTAWKYIDNTEKSSKGVPLFRVLANTPENVTIYFKQGTNVKHEIYSWDIYNITESADGNYDLYVDDVEIDSMISLKLGGVYTFVISQESPGKYSASKLTLTEPNSVNMLWLLPQYIVMTLGEVMYSVTGLQFSFNQAPESMKSVLQGCWMLTIAVGNLIVVIIAEIKIFEKQKYEFFLFAGLMFLDMAIFMVLAYYYKTIPITNYDEEEKVVPYTSITEKPEAGLPAAAFTTPDDEQSRL